MTINERLEKLSIRDWHVYLCLIALLALAVHNGFIQDDAFISFRYAQNLVEHGELAWNLGERVAGYTNFLWTLILTIPFLLGLDPVRFAQGIGLLCAIGTLLLTYRIALRAGGSKLAGLLAMTLLGTNFTFSAYATGGLETQLHVFLLTAATWLALRIMSGEGGGLTHCILLGKIAAIAMLTRLDSVLVLAVLFAAVSFNLLRRPGGNRGLRLAALFAPPVLATAGLLLWMRYYYGEALPNTFAVKAGVLGGAATKAGLLYLYEYFTSTYHLPVLLLPLFMIPSIWRNRALRLLAAAILPWTLYVVLVGGGFMEFRFLVALMPAAFAIVAVLLLETRDWRVQLAVLFFLLGGSYWHATHFNYKRGIESIRQLDGHITADNQNWRGVGEALGRVFGRADTPPTLAVTAAGAIPFYSELPAVDMLGLNDRFVAREGLPLADRPGHRRLAPSAYLVERGVNLVLGHPVVVHESKASLPGYKVADLAGFSLLDMSAEILPEGAKIIELPIELGYRVFILYLTPTPEIDRVIASRSLVVRPIAR